MLASCEYPQIASKWVNNVDDVIIIHYLV
jgi:hypothetical protein